MQHDKQFTLYSHKGTGPNGWKTAAILEELGLTYESIYLEAAEMKMPAYTRYNPNGRIPCIIDHGNNDFVLWESAAIITYLVDKYDPEHRLSAASADDRYQQLQWLAFQVSGQGPYFGQYVWFQKAHPEHVPSAVERYRKEIERVFGVLESVLSKQEWLVGGKLSVADIAFYHWDHAAISMVEGINFERFPAVLAWHRKLDERPSIRKVNKNKEVLLSK